MSRRLRAAAVLGLALALTGCGGSAVVESLAASSEAALTAPVAAETPAPAPTESPSPAPTPEPEAAAALRDGGDAEVIDLTTMSATMVYAQVYDMVMAPADYEGRTFTVTGQFTVYEGNPDNTDGADYYYTVTVADATACCQQGLEFVLPEGYTFPQDFPTEGATFTVTGVYTPYYEGDAEYYHLVAQSWTPA